MVTEHANRDNEDGMMHMMEGDDRQMMINRRWMRMMMMMRWKRRRRLSTKDPETSLFPLLPQLIPTERAGQIVLIGDTTVEGRLPRRRVRRVVLDGGRERRSLLDGEERR